MTDVKTLHIGSHVSFCGERHRISTITSLNGEVIGLEPYVTDADGVKHPLGYKIEDIEPIPITPKLLTDLGLEHRYKSPDDFRKRDKGLLIDFYRIRDSHDVEWRIIVEGRDGVDYGKTLCRYLHEAEAFLALYGVELIQD